MSVPAVGDWRESSVVRQARLMLADYPPSTLPVAAWAEVLRGVLAERDEIGAWLQRMIDAEYLRGKPAGWPDACASCGAGWTQIGFDHADGFNCRACGGTDADE